MLTANRRRHHDPYLELEAFIQEAQEDIGKVFEKSSVDRQRAVVTPPRQLLNGPSAPSGTLQRVSDQSVSLPGDRRRCDHLARSTTVVPDFNHIDDLSTEVCDLGSSSEDRTAGSDPFTGNNSSQQSFREHRTHDKPMVKRKQNTVQRSFSDVSSYKPSVRLRSKMEVRNQCRDNRVFCRPPSMIEDNIDILKSWAEHFVKQVHDAFSSMESLEGSENSLSGTDLSFKPGCNVTGNTVLLNKEEPPRCGSSLKSSKKCNSDVNGRHVSKQDSSNQTDEPIPCSNFKRLSKSKPPSSDLQMNGSDTCVNNSSVNHLHNSDLCPEFAPESSRRRSSSSSSSSSQIKPEEVASFMKRVEESIRSSKECDKEPSGNGHCIPVDCKANDLAKNLETNAGHDAMTQTSPDVSRCSSVLSLPTPNNLQNHEAISNDIPATSSSSSMDHVDEDSSSLSCLSDECTDPKLKSYSSSSPNDVGDGSSLSLSACSSSSVSCEDVNLSLADHGNSKSDVSSIVPVHLRCLPNAFHINQKTFPQGLSSVENGMTEFASSSLLSVRKCKCVAKSDPGSPQFSSVQVAVHPVVESLRSGEDLLPPAKSYSVPTLQSKPTVDDDSLSPTSDTLCHTNDCNQAFQTKTFPITAIKSHSRKHLAELEAAEACKWLRAAGFPQYAQMYEEHQFPVDISAVEKDHYFLDQNAIKSLFRRLNALNKCAKMKINNFPRQTAGADSDDEDNCALSENWMFTKSDRRWSRVAHEESEVPLGVKEQKSVSSSPKLLNVPGSNEAHSSFDSVLTADEYTGGSGHSPPSNTSADVFSEHDIINKSPSFANDGLPSPTNSPVTRRATRSVSVERSSSEEPSGNFHRSGSERVKDSAKALLKRVESLKSHRKKRGVASDSRNRDAVLFDSTVNIKSCKGKSDSHFKQRLKPPTLVLGTGELEDESNNCSINGTPLKSKSHSKKTNGRRSFGNHTKKIDAEALSDSECSGATSPSVFPTYLVPDANNTSLLEQYWKSSRLFPVSPKIHSPTDTTNGCSDQTHRISVYDNVPVVFFSQSVCTDDPEPLKHLQLLQESNLDLDIDLSSEDVFTEESTSNDKSLSIFQESSISKQHERRDSGVGLSLSRPVSTKRSSLNHVSGQVSIDCLSAGQMMVLKKLSLLKLTALMERYSPSNRSGWSWAMPKFIKRIKSPDYKDKTVFGLPLLLVLQRTGQPLPSCIQSIIHSLKKIASESVGLFRKSGVRSRIQYLKNLTENHQEKVNYENYQANDVADLLKQYFRALPEALLTNKLSETFISIFQYIPTEMRFEAMQAAIFLMPDENREVVQTLFDFLRNVSHKASENQMTASNLAVCFAPSLFHMSMPRSSSNSPRRRKNVGIPDQKELKENKAAQECLTQMISECFKLFSVSEEIVNQCRFSYSEFSNMITMAHVMKQNPEYSSSWDKYVENCTACLIRDTRPEKYLGHSKGWMPVSYSDNTTDLSCKKLGDGHPLKIWKVTTEVEAPPVELLNKILRERSTWDDHLAKWRIVQKVEKNTEIYQFLAKTMSSHPVREFCVIRTWRTDLARGGCVLIEESINHPDAQVPNDGVRGMILTSRYLIEPCGSGKSRVSHLSRIDMRGKSPEWYNRAYGHIVATYLTKLRDSFKHGTDGPETKV